MSELVERVDDVEAFLATPGEYHTTTAHQAFGVFQSLSWHPHVELEDLFFPEGAVLLAKVARPSLTPNAETIAWGTDPDYFERRLRDYDDWELAFWRELVQNARDAGATKVDITCEPGTFEDPETGDRVACVVARARDNGRGMNEETLMRAFFRRGGSEKTEGSVGGFGDAKNLILTPWLGYEVRTQDVIARGRHESIFAPVLTGQPFLQGTEITAWMPSTKATTPEHAQLLIEQSSLDIRFTINGKRADEKLAKGELVLHEPITVDGVRVGEILIHHSKRARRHGIFIRSYGIYMYKEYARSDSFKGVVTIDINAPPVDVFTTKRDALSFRSSARSTVSTFVNSLASEARQTLKAHRDKRMEVFKGAGSIDVRKGRVAESAAEVASKANLARSQIGKAPGGGAVKFKPEEGKKVVDYLRKAMDDLDDEGGASLPALPDTFGLMAQQTSFVNVEQVTGAMQLAMWRPDFMLYQNISPWKMPKTLHPDTMAPKYHKLLQVWAEVCKFVLVQIGTFKPFGVGWVFDTEYSQDGESVIAAAYSNHGERDWLLLNPVQIDTSGYGDDRKFTLTADRFNIGSPQDLEELVTLAVHECTHMQGFMSHNDSYASALTENMKAVFRIAPVLKGIVGIAKHAVQEERKAAKRAKQEPAKQEPGRRPKGWRMWASAWAMALIYATEMESSEQQGLPYVPSVELAVRAHKAIDDIGDVVQRVASYAAAGGYPDSVAWLRQRLSPLSPLLPVKPERSEVRTTRLFELADAGWIALRMMGLNYEDLEKGNYISTHEIYSAILASYDTGFAFVSMTPEETRAWDGP